MSLYRFALAVAAISIVAVTMSSSAGEPRTLDTRNDPYLEDGPSGRVLAAIHSELSVVDGRARLRTVISAVGPEVEPVPGYQGVHGSNHITAREMGRLFADGSLDFDGSIEIGRIGKVPERRFVPGQGFVLDTETVREYPLELVIQSEPVDPGRHVCELLVKGTPRLHIEFTFDGVGGAITEVKSLGVDLLR